MDDISTSEPPCSACSHEILSCIRLDDGVLSPSSYQDGHAGTSQTKEGGKPCTHLVSQCSIHLYVTFAAGGGLPKILQALQVPREQQAAENACLILKATWTMMTFHQLLYCILWKGENFKVRSIMSAVMSQVMSSCQDLHVAAALHVCICMQQVFLA